MLSANVLIGQVLLVFAIVIGAMWCATQWTAGALGYQTRLGSAWITLGHYPVYYPWRLFEWWYAFEAYAPRIFLKGGLIAATGSLSAAVVAIVSSILRARQHHRVTTYGSARWATPREVRQAGLLQPRGVFLGRIQRHYLRHDGPEHVMVFAPTRSGKGVGLVVPTLLTWPHSAVIHDMGDNWRATAGFRSQFSRCLLFNPTDARSAAYNPLLEVRRGAREIRDVQNIADILVDPEGALERRNHWEKTSHSLLVGAILHVLYAEADKTLAGVAQFLSDPQRPITHTLRRMMTTPHLGETVHPVIASAARELLNKSDNERSGVLSTAMSFLGLYRDPTVAAITRRCEWRIAELVDPERPASLYLVVPPSDISRTKPLMRLLLNQIGRRLTEDLKGATDRRPLLLMLDEFPALGRLDFFESALAFIAGYNLRAVLIAQSLNQIEKAYGPNNAVLDNCHVRVAFATNDERTGKRISDALGTATELRAQKNYAGHRLSPWLGHLMVSRQETARPLLTPGEIMQLPPDEEIVMVAGHPPVRAQKLRYYEDQNFRSRVLPPPQVQTGSSPPPTAAGDDWSALPPPAARVATPLPALDRPPRAQPADGGLLLDEDEALEEAPAAPRPERVGDLDAETNSIEVQVDEDSEEGFDRARRLAVLDPADGLPL
jgi:type IV secretion system protein VirD4